MNTTKIRLAGITNDSIVDGIGLRLTIFCQGCNKHPHCKDCHNPQTWSENGGEEYNIDDIINIIKKNPLLDGITFSGGEPFDQPKPLITLAKKVHDLNLTVWSFSGWTLDELLKTENKDIIELLHNIDVLVDGKFIPEEKDLSLSFRGSSNQSIIDLKKTFKNNKKVLLELE